MAGLVPWQVFDETESGCDRMDVNAASITMEHGASACSSRFREAAHLIRVISTSTSMR